MGGRILVALLLVYALAPGAAHSGDSELLLRQLGFGQLAAGLLAQVRLQARSAAQRLGLDDAAAAGLQASLGEALAPETLDASLRQGLETADQGALKDRLAALLAPHDGLALLEQLDSSDEEQAAFDAYRRRLGTEAPLTRRLAAVERLLSASHRVDLVLQVHRGVAHCLATVLGEESGSDSATDAVLQQALRASIRSLARDYFLYTFRYQDSAELEAYAASLERSEVQRAHALLRSRLDAALECRPAAR